MSRSPGKKKIEPQLPRKFLTYARRKQEELDRILKLVASTTEIVLHDVRNQFLPLSSYVDIVSSQDTQQRDAVGLRDVLAACRTFDATLKKIAALSRGTTNSTKGSNAAFAVDRAARVLRFIFGRELQTDTDTRDVSRQVVCDTERLVRAIVGLVGCSLESRGAHPRVHLKVRDVPGRNVVEISIEVTGQGGEDEATCVGVSAAHLHLTLGTEAKEARCDSTPASCACRFELDAALEDEKPPKLETTIASPGENVLVVSTERMARDLARTYLNAKGFKVVAVESFGAARDRMHLAAPSSGLIIDVHYESERDIRSLVDAAESAGIKAILLLCGEEQADDLRSIHPARLIFRPYRLPDLVDALRTSLDAMAG